MFLECWIIKIISNIFRMKLMHFIWKLKYFWFYRSEHHFLIEITHTWFIGDFYLCYFREWYCGTSIAIWCFWRLYSLSVHYFGVYKPVYCVESPILFLVFTITSIDFSDLRLITWNFFGYLLKFFCVCFKS